MDFESETDPGQIATECPLGDLSRGGVRLATAAPPKVGTLVKVTLHIPDEPEPLTLRGSVVWTLVSSGQIHSLAVMFAPYTSAAGANGPEMLERLVAIEARFLRADS